jgi:hypothetical protein
MAYPPAPAAGRNILRLIFADDPAEIVRLEIATSQSQGMRSRDDLRQLTAYDIAMEAMFAVAEKGLRPAKSWDFSGQIDIDPSLEPMRASILSAARVE